LPFRLSINPRTALPQIGRAYFVNRQSAAIKASRLTVSSSASVSQQPYGLFQEVADQCGLLFLEEGAAGG